MSKDNQIESHSGILISLSSSEVSGNASMFDKSIITSSEIDKQVAIIRTSHPIPDDNMGYYFEITILNQPGEPCHIDVGLTSRQLSFKKIVSEIKIDYSGLRNINNSFGYSSTGAIYGSSNGMKYSKKQKYRGGDTVGCYFHRKRRICCFVLNGILQNKILKIQDVSDSFFPTIVFYSKRTVVESKFCQKTWEVKETGTFNFNPIHSIRVKILPYLSPLKLYCMFVHRLYNASRSHDILAGTSLCHRACINWNIPRCMER